MTDTTIPTEAIGSIPRPPELRAAFDAFRAGGLSAQELERRAEAARLDTLRRLEATGSSCVGDGEQAKFDGFAGYCLHGACNLAPDGLVLEFADGHQRQLPRLVEGPFRYTHGADRFLEWTIEHACQPVKQAVISPSLLSLIYPNPGIASYSRRAFLKDLLEEHVQEVRRCLALGAHKVQIDFTEARLSLKIDPSGELLQSMVDLINRALGSFSAQERQRIGIHTCPGSDQDSTHSADVDYSELLPTLFQIEVGNFYVAMACEEDAERTLRLIKACLAPGARVFIGVIDPIAAEIETPELVKQRTLAAARHIPLESLGTTDDCGFSPFADDASTSREVAFRKIQARVDGTRLAARELAPSA